MGWATQPRPPSRLLQGLEPGQGRADRRGSLQGRWEGSGEPPPLLSPWNKGRLCPEAGRMGERRSPHSAEETGPTGRDLNRDPSHSPLPPTCHAPPLSVWTAPAESDLLRQGASLGTQNPLPKAALS